MIDLRKYSLTQKIGVGIVVVTSGIAIVQYIYSTHNPSEHGNEQITKQHFRELVRKARLDPIIGIRLWRLADPTSQSHAVDIQALLRAADTYCRHVHRSSKPHCLLLPIVHELRHSTSSPTQLNIAQVLSPRRLTGALRYLDAVAPPTETYFGQYTNASVRKMLKTTERKVRDIARGTKKGMQNHVANTYDRILAYTVESIAARLQQSIIDQDMPAFLKNGIENTVTRLIPDVQMEVYRKTIEFIRRSNRNINTCRPHVVNDHALENQNILFGGMRAYVLYHMFPYNKSIWASFKDPAWILFQLIGAIPIFGQLWWLFLLFLRGRTNEHLICDFIIGFKSSQFLSLGIISTIWGVFKYIRCTMHGLQLCMTEGPSLNDWTTGLFLIQIFVVWIIFLRLPYTQSQTNRPLRRRRRPSGDSRTDWFGNTYDSHRGGHLLLLFQYETICMWSIIMLFGLIFWMEIEKWQSRSMLYWVRALYGALSLPYIPFKLPFVTALLTHTERYGYNHMGQATRYIPRRAA